jgi:hypothetical protein
MKMKKSKIDTTGWTDRIEKTRRVSRGRQVERPASWRWLRRVVAGAGGQAGGARSAETRKIKKTATILFLLGLLSDLAARAQEMCMYGMYVW